MKNAQRLVWITILALGGLAAGIRADEPKPAQSAPAEQKPAELTPLQRHYYFEHQLLPRWTHGSKGAFYADLVQGRTERLIEAATEIVGREFAAALKVRPLTAPEGVLLVFPRPDEVPECFAAAVLRDGDGFRYFTLEKGEDIMKDGTKAFLCEWRKQEGKPFHANLGPRHYDDAEKFVEELRQITAKPVTPKAPDAPRP
ncbi:MAG: hypothetical protein ACHQ5A_03910 [Opitutales bacterium]